MIYSLADRKPDIGDDCYIADNATVIGSVVLGSKVSIWFNAVVRGDNDVIRIGEGTNVQDGAVLHVDEGVGMQIGCYVSVGHKAMLHGCTVGDNTLIGINSVVLNHASIGANCIIGANALVTEGKEIPEGSLVLGSPGRVVRSLEADEIRGIRQFANEYIAQIEPYRTSLRPRAR